MLVKIKEYLEYIEIRPKNWIIGVSGVLMVRFFLESISSPTSTGFFASDASTLLHYYLFFLCFTLVFMLFIQVFVPKLKKVAPELVSISLFSIFIAPIVDFIVSRGGDSTMTYFFYPPSHILDYLLTFLGFNIKSGITLGIKVEVVVILFSIGLLVYLYERSISRVIVSIISLYLIIFTFLSFPVILSFVFGEANVLDFLTVSIKNSVTNANNLHSSFSYISGIRFAEVSFNFMMARIWFVLLSLLASLWFYLNHKEKFLSILKNSRPERVAHFFFMILLGIFTAKHFFPSIHLNWNDYISITTLFLSFYFSWMFAVCVNDYMDVDIDLVTNTDRPLIKNQITKSDMEEASFIFLYLSVIAGFLAGYTALFFSLTFTALYYIYSAFPTRFKMVPFFSSFIIGLCCLTALMAGFYILSPLKTVEVFPNKLIVSIVTIFFLWAHIRDMKDINGDRLAGVPTVPVIFGNIWGPRVVGFLSSLAFLLVPIFSNIHILFLIAIPASIVNYYFVTKNPYKEKPVFKTYLFFVVMSAVILFV